jgi:hypothetical protein
MMNMRTLIKLRKEISLLFFHTMYIINMLSMLSMCFVTTTACTPSTQTDEFLRNVEDLSLKDLLLEDLSLIDQFDQLIEEDVDQPNQLIKETDQALNEDMNITLDMMFEDADLEQALGCETYTSSPSSVTLNEHALPEASGLTISGINAQILWSHNDSGSASEIIALNVGGSILGSIILPNMTNDLEDIDEAPCLHRAGRCLWIGDVGDNTRQREILRLWITPEPLLEASFDTIRITSEQIPIHTFVVPFILEGGAADIEALVVDHLGRRVWLFEKREEGQVQVWLIDFNLEQVNERLTAWLRGDTEPEALIAQKLTSFEAPGIAIPYGRMITAADLSPDGTRLLIRVYTGIYEYRFSEPYMLSSLNDINPVRIALGPINEPQGEALSYGWRGEGVWSISESLDVAQPLNYFKCQDSP